MSSEAIINLVNVQIIPWSLFFIMLGMGLSLVPDDFRRVVKYPKAVALGLSCQLLFLPIVGFILANLMPITPELAVGIMLLAVCPGGTTSNLFAHLARGDVALSVTLTAVASVITVFTIPFIVNGSLQHFMGEGTAIRLPVIKTMLTLIWLTVLPISIGMLIRRYKSEFAIKAEGYVKQFAVIFLAALVIFLCYQQREILLQALLSAGPITLILNVSTMLMGYGASRWLDLNRDQSISITLEVGLQNSSLAVVMALSLLANYEMSLTPAIYTLVMFTTASVLVYWASRGPGARARARAQAAASETGL